MSRTFSLGNFTCCGQIREKPNQFGRHFLSSVPLMRALYSNCRLSAKYVSSVEMAAVVIMIEISIICMGRMVIHWYIGKIAELTLFRSERKVLWVLEVLPYLISYKKEIMTYSPNSLLEQSCCEIYFILLIYYGRLLSVIDYWVIPFMYCI